MSDRAWAVAAVVTGAASGVAFACSSPMLVAGPLLVVMLPFALLLPSALKAYPLVCAILGACAGLLIGLSAKGPFSRIAAMLFLAAAPMAGHVVNGRIERGAKAVVGGIMAGARGAAEQERKRLYDVEGYHRIVSARIAPRSNASGWEVSLTVRGQREAEYSAEWGVYSGNLLYASVWPYPKFKLGKGDNNVGIFLDYGKIREGYLRQEENRMRLRDAKPAPPPAALTFQVKLEPEGHPYAYGLGDIVEIEKISFPVDLGRTP